jgi:hypothetical protein
VPVNRTNGLLSELGSTIEQAAAVPVVAASHALTEPSRTATEITIRRRGEERVFRVEVGISFVSVGECNMVVTRFTTFETLLCQFHQPLFAADAVTEPLNLRPSELRLRL